MPAKRGEIKQQMDLESWQEQEEVSGSGYLPTEEVRVKVVPKWSDIFASSKSPTSNRESKSPEDKHDPASQRRHRLLALTYDARVEELRCSQKRTLLNLQASTHAATTTSRRQKMALGHLQKEAELYILQDLLRDSIWSKHIRDDFVIVEEVSQRRSGHK